MGGKRVELEGEARRKRDNARAKEYQRKRRGYVERTEPIGRTGEEEALGWRLRREQDGMQKVFVDPYYRHVNCQTKATWEPANGFGVFGWQMVLQGFERRDVVEVFKRRYRFGRYIAVPEEVKGTDRQLWEVYFRLPQRPSDAEVEAIYRDFCQSP